MNFQPLTRASLMRRYKRFLADVLLPDGDTPVCVHCPNTGAMTGCLAAESAVWLSHHDNPKRKLAWTWELVETEAGMACIHSARANDVVEEALRDGHFPALFPAGADLWREVKLAEGSRADFFIPADDGLYVEVKSVTLHCGDGAGAFPDAVSARATKHLLESQAAMERGHRAALVFAVLHAGITRVSPAQDIDPIYALALRQAMGSGLEVYTLLNDITVDGIYPVAAHRWYTH
jgi:sugar fermentation stimulation protein A